MKLMDGFDSNYRYVLVAARRARQLAGGAPPLVETGARKACRIARDEIAAGKVQYTKTTRAEAATPPAVQDRLEVTGQRPQQESEPK